MAHIRISDQAKEEAAQKELEAKECPRVVRLKALAALNRQIMKELSLEPGDHCYLLADLEALADHTPEQLEHVKGIIAGNYLALKNALRTKHISVFA